MSEAKIGDTVKVDYACFSEDGEIVNETRSEAPLQFTIGEGEIIPGFEEAILGMKEGEEKKTTVPMEKAFGPRREEHIVAVEKERLPGDINFEVGQPVRLKSADGSVSLVRIVDLSGDLVTLDVNHPLAGQNLIFNIKLLEIV